MANTLTKLNVSTLRSSHRKLFNKIIVLKFWKFPRKSEQMVKLSLSTVAVSTTFREIFQRFSEHKNHKTAFFEHYKNKILT